MSNTKDLNLTTIKPTQGFGAELATARKKRLMSTKDVAGELNILKRHVEAIESEDYDSLPQQAFARGFVVNYAKLVGLNAHEIATQFDMGYPTHLKEDSLDTIKAPLKPTSTLTRGRTPIRFNIGLIVGIVAVLVFGIAILKMVGGAKEITSTGTNNDVQVVDTLSTTEQAQGAAIDNAGSALSGANTQTGSAVLDFWVKESSSIKVTDGTGQTLMSGEQNRGGYQIMGVPPLTVEVNNPSSVDLNYNQNPIDWSAHATDTGTVVTLQ